MPARKIARTVDEFHLSDKGQAFQQQRRNAQRLNVMTKPEEITDYLNSNNYLKPFIAVACENKGVLYGIKLDHDRTTQRLFFRHAMRPDLRMQMSLMQGRHGHEMGSITAATGLELDKQGNRPDALFTPMIQAVLSHMALEQQAWRLATATSLPIADAREAITVPWMPFFARQLSSQCGAVVRRAEVTAMPVPYGQKPTSFNGELDITIRDAPGKKLTLKLSNGVLMRGKATPLNQKAGRTPPALGQQSYALFHDVYTCVEACQETVSLMGLQNVQNKPWAIDLLHETRLYANGLSLFVPNRPADDPNTFYFELHSPASIQTGFVVDRRGEVHVTTGGNPLVPIHEIRTMARAIPSRYPLPQRYP